MVSDDHLVHDFTDVIHLEGVGCQLRWNLINLQAE